MSSSKIINTGKLPGKTQFSGRRRITTRKSGFSSHPDSTGGEYKVEDVESHNLAVGEFISIEFQISDVSIGEFLAYGGWYNASNDVNIKVDGGPDKKVITPPDSPNWSKVGSMWIADSGDDVTVTVTITAIHQCEVALYEFACGIVKHKHLDWAKKKKPVLLSNMYEFSPEANFITTPGTVHIDCPESLGTTKTLYLKSCNRCARFLPINTDNERYHLSFSNHCVAKHRIPCSHGGFGKLKNILTGEIIHLKNGYQLECRFCKKYEVNAAHNPQRTAAQMKEDGARRRAIELLLTELYDGSSQLQFRLLHNNKELTNQIWEKFKGHCFNCEIKIKDIKSMHLDHTRPLALLWPLDETATCLCNSCNSQKRDRPPGEFYSEEKLEALSKITKIPLSELIDPTPNLEAVELLLKKLEWFFGIFLTKPELTKIRDGKAASELLVKALQKTLDKCQGGAPLNLSTMYVERSY